MISVVIPTRNSEEALARTLSTLVTAAADGAIAAVAAEKYLDEMEHFRESVLDKEEPVLLAFWAPQVEASFDVLANLEKIVEGKNGAVH